TKGGRSGKVASGEAPSLVCSTTTYLVPVCGRDPSPDADQRCSCDMPIAPFRLGGAYAVVASRFQGHHANKWLSQFLIVCVIIRASFVQTPAITQGEEKILLFHT